MNPTTPNNDPQQPNVPQENFDNQNTTPQQGGAVDTGQQTTPVPPAGNTGGAPLQDAEIIPPTEPTDPGLEEPVSFPETQTTPDLPEQNAQNTTSPVEPINFDTPNTTPADTPEATPNANPNPEETGPIVNQEPAAPTEQPHTPPLTPPSAQGTPMPDENVDEKIRQTGDGATMSQPQAIPEKKGNWFTRLFGGK